MVQLSKCIDAQEKLILETILWTHKRNYSLDLFRDQFLE